MRVPFLHRASGQIDTSAVSIVSELLILCGAILGVKACYNVKFRKFQAELNQVIEDERRLNCHSERSEDQTHE